MRPGSLLPCFQDWNKYLLSGTLEAHSCSLMRLVGSCPPHWRRKDRRFLQCSQICLGTFLHPSCALEKVAHSEQTRDASSLGPCRVLEGPGMLSLAVAARTDVPPWPLSSAVASAGTSAGGFERSSSCWERHPAAPTVLLEMQGNALGWLGGPHRGRCHPSLGWVTVAAHWVCEAGSLPDLWGRVKMFLEVHRRVGFGAALFPSCLSLHCAWDHSWETPCCEVIVLGWLTGSGGEPWVTCGTDSASLSWPPGCPLLEAVGLCLPPGSWCL